MALRFCWLMWCRTRSREPVAGRTWPSVKAAHLRLGYATHQPENDVPGRPDSLICRTLNRACSLTNTRIRTDYPDLLLRSLRMDVTTTLEERAWTALRFRESDLWGT